jgi:hypothetical protein
MQPFNDRRGRFLGNEETAPEIGIEIGKALLVRARNLRERRPRVMIAIALMLSLASSGIAAASDGFLGLVSPRS